ncbi:MAG: NUDIX hydrolase [Candidatus Omnitrophica bacterium]|nr:NUDIX hydrolase [Candidatus Omnitrophota bacterium]
MAEKEFSAGGVIIRGSRNEPMVLLIKDSYGHWTWPKGKLKSGESPKDAAIREIWEETGLKDIELIESLGKTEYSCRRQGRQIFKTVHLYLFWQRSGEELKIQHDEIQEGAWFTPDEALDKIEYDGAVELLKKAIAIFLHFV